MIQEIDVREIVWYKIIGLSTLKNMLYKVDYKRGCNFLPHGKKCLHKLQTPMKQAKSNVQCLIDLRVDTIRIK
jgi:hypothetical protein